MTAHERMMWQLPHDAHYWKYLFVNGRVAEYLELETKAYWALHPPARQQRMIERGLAPRSAMEMA